MMSFLGFLVGTKLGRYVAGGLLLAALLFTFIVRIYSAGRAAERARQQEAAIKALRERMKIDDEVGKLAPAQRTERLRRWVREDSGV